MLETTTPPTDAQRAALNIITVVRFVLFLHRPYYELNISFVYRVIQQWRKIPHFSGCVPAREYGRTTTTHIKWYSPTTYRYLQRSTPKIKVMFVCWSTIRCCRVAMNIDFSTSKSTINQPIRRTQDEEKVVSPTNATAIIGAHEGTYRPLNPSTLLLAARAILAPLWQKTGFNFRHKTQCLCRTWLLVTVKHVLSAAI